MFNISKSAAVTQNCIFLGTEEAGNMALITSSDKDLQTRADISLYCSDYVWFASLLWNQLQSIKCVE